MSTTAATSLRAAPRERYHPLLVALHWIGGLLILFSLYGGIAVLREIPNASPEKLQMLQGHVFFGLVILVAMILRLIVRATTKKPARAKTGNALVDGVSVAVNVGLYLCVFGMVGTGIATLGAAHLFPDVMWDASKTLPATFWDFPPRTGHYFFSRLLLVLVALHILAALYHQFVLKDGLLGRMWFGRRSNV